MTNNLVIYYLEGTMYDISGIKVTLKSLREHYNGRIILLYNTPLLLEKNLYNICNVELVDCSSYKIKFLTSPYNNKILYTYYFLRKNQNEFKTYNIFISDITDFYFKSNPFLLQTKELTLTQESNEIGICETNKIWIQVCFDNYILNKIKDNKVINGGFVLGTFEQVYKLYDLVTKEMGSIFAKINYPIVDQAIINKLVYFDKLPATLNNKNINHLAQKVKTDLNNDIIHQYKVFEHHKKELFSKYE